MPRIGIFSCSQYQMEVARFRTLPSQEKSGLPLVAPSPNLWEGTPFPLLVSTGLLQNMLLGLWTNEVLRVSQAALALHGTIFSLEGFASFRRASSMSMSSSPRGLHTVEGHLWLHGLFPLRTVKDYALAFRAANVKLATKSSGEYFWGEPLRFDSQGEAEAAGVMWMKLMENRDVFTTNFLMEFHWRPETIKSFFDAPGSTTHSSLTKITVEDPDGDQRWTTC